MLNVLVVADDVLAQMGLIMLLNAAQADLTLTQADSSVWDDDDWDEYDVLLVDLGWETNQNDALPAWRESALPVVAMVADEETAVAAWLAGATGIIKRNDQIDGRFVDRALAALEAAANRLHVIEPAFVNLLVATPSEAVQPLLEPLSTRERQVLARLAEGDTNKMIAQALSISDNTVKFHVNAVMGKLGVQSRTEAVVQALRLGLLSL